MSSVIAFKHKENLFYGAAMCLNCLHEWNAAVPSGHKDLECLKCGLFKGVIKTTYCSEESLFCGCGNNLMSITKEGFLCVNCGDFYGHINNL